VVSEIEVFIKAISGIECWESHGSNSQFRYLDRSDRGVLESERLHRLEGVHSCMVQHALAI